MLLGARAQDENERGFEDELRKKKLGVVFLARRRNHLFQNLLPKSTGRSTFNGRDHDREIVGTCQPFPAKISVTEQNAEGFEEGQAPKQINFEVDFIRDQGRRIEKIF